ncbi:MAG: GMC oxidoreductase [Azonexus sp.]|nr:GMC oxidoreductase [Azonexus sp.]
MTNKTTFKAVVIGSGFGGAVTCCRLAMKWPGEVLLLERGARYPKGSFPRSPKDFSENFWSTAAGAKAPLKGLFDIRNYRRMDAVVAAGLGGGSLIYANVFMAPPRWVFDTQWPSTVQSETLAPYYQVARDVLGARQLPPAGSDPRRQIPRSDVFAQFAARESRQSKPAEICVFFGNGYARNGQPPLPIGEQESNRYGASQTACTYCGECDIGCNVHAKNTLDLNYLYAAEHTHGARIETSCIAEKICPLNAAGEDDSTANGQHGYRVHYRDGDGCLHAITAERVVLAAGTLGSNELLLRCRDEFGTLPRVSQQLGKRFSGNGDFVSVVVAGDTPIDPNYGPVITQYIDYDLHTPKPGQPAFMLEDAAYPTLMSWYVEGLQPMLNPLYLIKRLFRTLGVWGRRVRQTLFGGKWSGSVVDYFHQLLRGDIAYRSSVLLFMGRDQGDGELSLRRGNLDLNWPQKASRPLYDAIVACGRRFGDFIGAKAYIPQPTWAWPIRNNVTVHPLGGCALAENAAKGVVSCQPGERGQVFGYHGLYVADGAILPASVGANPSATIAALAEWIAEDITGMTPDATLGVPDHD